jgi:hypothetical protein
MIRTAMAADNPRVALCGLFPEQIAELLLKIAGDSPERMLSVCRDYTLPVTGTKGFEQAQVTTGGVRICEVDPDTMESRICPGIYFAGEILDVDGNIRPGCYIVPKGMVYEYSGFQPKEKLFKQRSFTDEARGFFTGLINELVPEEDKLTVFPRGGPFLATQKIGKNNPKEAEIRKSNEVRQEWNAAVSGAMMRGMPVEDLKEMKKKLIIEPVAGSIKKHGKDPARFIRILKKAVVVLIEKARSFRPSILASLERFKDESAKQDRKRRSVREAVKDRERIAERSRKKSR